MNQVDNPDPLYRRHHRPQELRDETLLSNPRLRPDESPGRNAIPPPTRNGDDDVGGGGISGEGDAEVRGAATSTPAVSSALTPRLHVRREQACQRLNAFDHRPDDVDPVSWRMNMKAIARDDDDDDESLPSSESRIMFTMALCIEFRFRVSSATEISKFN